MVLGVVFKISALFQVVTRWPRDNDTGIVESTVDQLSKYFLFTSEDAKHVLFIAVGLTILRFILDTMLFKVSVHVCVLLHLPNVLVPTWHQENVVTCGIMQFNRRICNDDSHNPLCSYHLTCIMQQIPKWVQMEKSSAAKFPESAFSFMVYSFAWSWSVYVVATNPKGLFTNLASHWNGKSSDDMLWTYVPDVGNE